MPYNEATLDRLRIALSDLGINFSEKAMFGGICIMVDDKMFCATKFDKKLGQERLLCRVGDTVAERVLEQEEHCIPMDKSGKGMKGFVYVLEEGFRNAKDLKRWLQLCKDYNPLAQKSKK